MEIDGVKIAEEILARLKARPAPKRFLAAVLVGGDPASLSFVEQKGRVARELGVDFRATRLSADVSESELIAEIKKFAHEEECGGIILQLPLPASLGRDRIIAAIPPAKDVDNLRGGDLVPPPAAGVVEEILKTEKCQPRDKIVAVVGLGFLVGKPVAQWLKGKVKAPILLDIGDNLARLKDADIVILGAGKAGLVAPAMLKPGTLVIDFGCSRGADEKLHGDFSPSRASLATSYKLRYTPTPGGTGPILVAKLFENFYALNVHASRAGYYN
jgi:methylenetetrahydrofolate dehydrogenase (NADP+)/methenyltetrahydrofolate cyclohydrolase